MHFLRRHRHRVALIVALVAMILASLLGVAHITEQRALQREAANGNSQLMIQSMSLRRLIDSYRMLPILLSLDPELRDALSHPVDASVTARLNRKLQQATDATHPSTLTLINRHGVAIAANNWRDPGSNVGINYSFRPYFQRAMRDGSGTFYAVGVSTREPGYFIAQAVLDGNARRIGVVVVKINLKALQMIGLGRRDTLLVSDSHGIVIVANQPQWMYRKLHPLAAATKAELLHTRQYDERALLPVDITTDKPVGDGGRLVRIRQPAVAGRMLWLIRDLPQQHWQMHLLLDTRSVHAAVRNAVAATALLWLPLILFGMFLQQRLRLARVRQRSREELERLVAHYASALRSEQDSLVQAAQQAAAGHVEGLERLPQGVSVVDAKLRLVAWNRRYANLMQFPPELLRKGRPVEELFRHNARRGLLGPGDVEEAIQRRLDYLRDGSPHMYERERPDGSVLEIRGNPLPDGGFVTSYADITAYKDAARELRTLTTTLENRIDAATREQRLATVEAKRANRNKTRYVAAAVHDLLQPLNAARLFAGALREPLHAAPDRALLARVEHALQALDSQLTSMLDLSRLDAGGFKTRVSVFALGPILRELAKQFGIVAQACALQLHFVDTCAWVHSDPTLLRRVLQNFLSNAVHYTPNGRVLLGCRRDGDHLCIEVWDTGVGIADDQREAIFEEFHRLDSGVDDDERNAGLGLSIVQRIAQLLGHPITVRSWPGRGSMFAVRVPRASATPIDVASDSLATDSESPLSGRYIVCIDDDAATRSAMTALLQRWGCTVVTAADAIEAIRLADLTVAPDLLLLDYHLGTTNGPALLPELQQRWGVMPPVILLTADGDASLRAPLQATGLQLMLKPVSPSRLRALMSRLLTHHG